MYQIAKQKEARIDTDFVALRKARMSLKSLQLVWYSHMPAIIEAMAAPNSTAESGILELSGRFVELGVVGGTNRARNRREDERTDNNRARRRCESRFRSSMQ